MSRRRTLLVNVVLLAQVVREEGLRILLRPAVLQLAMSFVFTFTVFVYLLTLAVIFTWIGQGVPAGH